MAVETRPYTYQEGVSTIGRSLLYLLCPFCGETVTAYRWSLAGSGRRCNCGAKFSYSPMVAKK